MGCANLDAFATGGCGEVDAGRMLLSAGVLADKDDDESAYVQAFASYTDEIVFLCGGQTCPEGTATFRAGIKGEFSPALLDPWNSFSSTVWTQALIEIESGPRVKRKRSVINCRDISATPCFDLFTRGTGSNQPVAAMVEIVTSLDPLDTNEFTVRTGARAEADPGFRCPSPGYCPPLEPRPNETEDQFLFASLATVQWLGIEVRDSEGTLIPDVTAVSPTSGIDWAQPVPEPGGCAASAGALALAAGLAKVRRRGSRCVPRS